MTPVVSVTSLDTGAKECATVIRDALRKEAIPLDEREDDRADVFGVVVFFAANAQFVRRVHDRAAGGNRTLVVIAAPGATLHDDLAWQLLAAGAADVFAWDHSSSPARDLNSS